MFNPRISPIDPAALNTTPEFPGFSAGVSLFIRCCFFCKIAVYASNNYAEQKVVPVFDRSNMGKSAGVSPGSVVINDGNYDRGSTAYTATTFSGFGRAAVQGGSYTLSLIRGTGPLAPGLFNGIGDFQFNSAFL
jgi:hypothetical protein